MSDSQLFSERYEMDREVGAGGMARVFLALDIRYERPVAIKILRPELASGIGRTRFLREIMIAAKLNHPHILPLFDSGEFDGMLFFVMPFVEGPSLRVRLMQEGKLGLRQSLDVTRNVASALDYAHRKDIVHRDIKPENIMTHDGVAMVADFGIGKALSNAGNENLTQAGVMIGTPAYMSPEQIAGDPDIDGRSDIYSLACVLFEMLAGEKPFSAATPQGSLSIRFTKPPPDVTEVGQDIPPSVSDAIKKALAPDKNNRFDTAAEFIAALADSETTTSTHAESVAAARGGPSVAVLPFANMSPDPDNEYFSDGITEEIINALMQLKHLHVAARTSSFTFKGKNADIHDIGAKLNVATVLEGSVRRSGSRVRITAQLISVAGGHNVWSERYDRELDDVFAIQDEIATTIADRLKVALTSSVDIPAVKRPTEDIDAYQLYLRGRYLWNRRTEEGLCASIEHFDKAIERDPNFALAYAGKADAYLLLGSYMFLPRDESYQKAKAAAEKALELDESLAEAHTSFGQSLRGELDWSGEENAYRRAIALNPNYATVHQWYGGLLGVLGRLDEALTELRAAEKLDPLSHAISNTVASVLLQARRWDEALEQTQRTLELAPDFLSARALSAHINAHLRNREEALSDLERLLALRSDHPYMLTHRAMIHAALGEVDVARSYLEEAKADPNTDLGFVSLVLASLGEHDEAFEYLDRAKEKDGLTTLSLMKGHPAFDSIRSDPRFRKLLREMGLPEDG